MIQLPKNVHSKIMIWGLMITVFALPLSVFVISIGQIILILNWITDGPFGDKWYKFKQRKSLWFISLFYIVHLVWLFNTTDFLYAFHDLKIKLPFLIIPLIIGTSEVLNYEQLKKVLIAFCTGVFISTFYTTLIIFSSKVNPAALGIDISPFVSHIRLALMVDFSIIILFWISRNERNVSVQIIYILFLVWFFAFLFILQSLTGVIVFFVLAAIYTIIYVSKSKNLILRWFLAISIVIVVLLPASYLVHTYTNYFSPLPIDTASINKFTQNGNEYYNDFHSRFIENGNYIYLNICDKELKKEWEKRSKIKYEDKNELGQEIKFTLFRYLASLGLLKDSVGISHLTKSDIVNIENGIPNPIYLKKGSLTPRIYRLMWELYHYYQGANPTGYSVAQRIEYLKTASRIISKNFWFGTGTGDVLNAFKEQYKTDNSQLEEKWRLRAHNQLVTFLLTFGILGFVVIIISLFIPPITEKSFSNPIFAAFFILFVLSMLNEDTLETHAGISFISVFYSLLLYSSNKYKLFVPKKKNVEIS